MFAPGLERLRRATRWMLILCLFAAPAFAVPTKLGDLNDDGVLDVFDLTRLREHIRQTNSLPQNLVPFADITADGFINEDDSVALIYMIVGASPEKALPLDTIRETSPFAGESGVALTREVIVRFTMPLSLNAVLTTWDPNTQSPGTFYAEAGGRKLLTRVELSGDRLKATLFFLEIVPASTRVLVTFNGAGLNDLLERPLDPDGDGAEGGVRTFTYDSAPITPVIGTGIIGHVYASERAAGQTTDTPLPGVLVRVVGSEDLFTYTAADGSFSLNPCPAGRFFVEVDGRTSALSDFPDGAYYPYINKPWEALPGKADNLAAGTGVIYLPLVVANSLQPVSATATTTIRFPPSVIDANPALAGVEIYVPPNSLFADDGTRGGKVGLAPVASDRLPEPLPPGLSHALDISIQTDGPTNFDRPVPVRFPNLPDPVTGIRLPPGAKSALWSYNHDKGAWEVAGPMTVTNDGNFVVTDSGVGVRQPGWHGTMPGVQAIPPDLFVNIEPGSGDPDPCDEVIEPELQPINFSGISVLPKPGTMIRLNPGFVATIQTMNALATQYGIKLEVQQSFRIYGSPVPGAIVPPGDRSNHLVGRAIDVNVLYEGETGEVERCNSVCMGNSSVRPPEITAFLNDVTATGVRWGGNFQRRDPVHFDDGLNLLNPTEWAQEFSKYQRTPCPEDQRIVVIRNLALPNGQSGHAGTFVDPYYFLVRDESTGEVLIRNVANLGGGSLEPIRLPAENHFSFWVYAPRLNATGWSILEVPEVGPIIQVPPVFLTRIDATDVDGDGLSSDAEFVVGTNPGVADTDGDGISDGTEISNGTNPLDGLPFQTGVVNSVDTPGSAKDIAAQNTVALLADSNEGVSVFNVANALNPVRVAQVRLSGSTEAVALDGPFAAATGSSLALLDLSNLSAVRVTRQLFLGSVPRSVAAAGGIACAGLDNGQLAAVDMAAGAELERLQVSTEPIQDLSFAGDVLYARSSSRVYAIELSPLGMSVADSVAVAGTSAGRQRLFVGVGLAYAPMETGYTILSLADPLHPTVAQTISVAQRGWREFVPTGSGLGLGVFTNFGAADVHLYNIGVNGIGSQFLTTFTTPGDSEAVSIYNGLAYIADGDAGLTVVNYKAYDALGLPPTITIITGFPTVDGTLRAEEGKLGRVTGVVFDDVQVRNVEFYLDGQLVITDGNFPFEHRFITPLLTPDKTSFTLRAKATDTGGNSTWSDTLTVTLVPDATPPRVIRFFPSTGSFTGSIRDVAATFSEPINPATLTAESFVITGAGPDGIFNTSDDFVPTGGATTYREASNTAFISFSQNLPPSLYRLVARPPVADLAGNVIASFAQSQFRVFAFQDSDGDGIPDDVELLLGLDPFNPDSDGNGIRDGDEDYDHDGLSNAAEIAFGLDPLNPDSNGNGILDGDEDPDHDGLSNQHEALAGTDPNNPDTDGDGWNDETEVTAGSNPLDADSRPIGLVASIPQVNLTRLGDATAGVFGNASTIAQPPVFVTRISVEGFGSFIAQPPVSVTRGPEEGFGAFVAQPPVFVEIQNP